MRIALIVEGRTEEVLLPHLRAFLKIRLASMMPKIDPVPYHGLISSNRLKGDVARLLHGPRAADYVIALTDVYTGTQPPQFVDAADAKIKMRQWVGEEPRFYPHAAQHDFEAWLLPYWSTIQKLSRSNRACPSGTPESVNHNNPPARRIKEVFQTGSCRDSYVKPRDADRILRDNGLTFAIDQCSELKKLINTFLRLSGGSIVI